MALWALSFFSPLPVGLPDIWLPVGGWTSRSCAYDRAPRVALFSALFPLVDRSPFARADPPSYEAICLFFLLPCSASPWGRRTRDARCAGSLSPVPLFFYRLLSLFFSFFRDLSGRPAVGSAPSRPPFRCALSKSRAAHGGAHLCFLSFSFFVCAPDRREFMFSFCKSNFLCFFLLNLSFIRRSTTAAADSARRQQGSKKKSRRTTRQRDREMAPQGPTTCDRGAFPAAQGGKIERATVGTRRATGIHQKN